MPDWDVAVQSVLDGFAKFLAEKGLALPRQRPYLVRWVRDFLFFARPAMTIP